MSSLDLVASSLGLVQKNNDNHNGFDGIFLDDIRTKESLDLSVSIPNTFVEDGNYVNDHTIFNPKTLSIEGEVGEVYQRDNSTLNEYFTYSDKLGVISQYTGTKTATQLTKINKIANDSFNVIRQYEKIQGDIDYVKDSFIDGNKAIQTKFIDFINNDLYTQGKLITIETSLGYFTDMKLVSANITKDNTSGQYLRYKLNFQKWRTAKTILTPFEKLTSKAGSIKNKTAGDAKNQTDKTSDKGNVQGKEDKSLASTIKDLLGF